MNLQTGDGHMVTSTMHDMKVMKTFNVPQKSGALMVELSKDAVFAFSYGGLTEDEAIALAEKFDWKAMQAAAQKKYGGGHAHPRPSTRHCRVPAARQEFCFHQAS
jgi:hypothetical protein